MNTKCEVRNEYAPILKIESMQSWISIKNYVPSGDMKGSYCGRYWCICERPYVRNEKYLMSCRPEHSRTISHSYELCYWNDLAHMFQDKDNKWVKVTHWIPIPEKPQRKFRIILRSLMLQEIEAGKFELIESESQRRTYGIRFVIDEYWDFTKKNGMEFLDVSYDEEVFYSSEIDKDGYEDCMWCIKK